GQSLLTQKEMPGRAHLQIGAAGHRRPWPDQVGRLQQPRTALALVAARTIGPAVRTSADDIAIGEETPVVERIDLVQRALLDETALVQAFEEVLGQRPVMRRRRAAEMIE